MARYQPSPHYDHYIHHDPQSLAAKEQLAKPTPEQGVLRISGFGL